MQVKQIRAKEITINETHAGFMANGFFYPAPGIHLGPYELQAIAKDLQDDAKMCRVSVTWEFYAKRWVELPHGYRIAIIEQPAQSRYPKAGEIAYISGDLYEIRGVELNGAHHIGLCVAEIKNVIRDENGRAKLSTHESEYREAFLRAELDDS